MRKLSQQVRGATVLDGVDLDLAAGEALVVAGVNGAGRSTLLHVLATLLEPTAGEVAIDGLDARREPVRVRRRIGFLGQCPSFHPRLTAGEHLEFVAASRGMAADRGRAVAAALEPADLEPERPIDGLSPGLRQQLGLASALLGEPPLLLLDEPLAALDPLARRRFGAALEARRRTGAALVVACNSFEDLPAGLSDRIAFLHRGRLVDWRPDDRREDPAAALAALAAGRMPAGARDLARRAAPAGDPG